MPNTETNKKHDEIVERLQQELINSGRYTDFLLYRKSGYDIQCIEKKSQCVVYFAALLYGNRLYDATTLEEWEMAMKNETNFFFVAAVEQDGNLVFFYFPPRAFMLTCSIPKFKIRSSLRTKDIEKYKTIKDFAEVDELQALISPSERRVAVQLTQSTLKNLSIYWNELKANKG